MKIYITGHKSPDLDSIVSAIAYADLLEKTKRYPTAEIIPARAGEINKETEFILNKFNAEIPMSLNELSEEALSKEDSFILVDHNEESQRHKLIKNHQVLELVDHHKVNINFASPLQINVRPLGSTSSIVYELYEKENVNPSKKMRSLILSAILSDTQGLKSSTTAGLDSEIARSLAKELEIVINDLTFEIFKAKSDISGLSSEEITTKDYKMFDFDGNKVFINQIETVEPERVFEKLDKLVNKLEDTKTELGANIGYIIITDIMEVNSHVIYTNEEEKRIIEEAFTTEGEDGLADIGPRMSRKKDIAPEIEKVLMEK